MIKGFSLDIYDCDVSFAWDTNEKELNAFFDKVDAPEDYREGFWEAYNKSGVVALTSSYSAANMFVIFHEEPSNKTVAHELFHVAYNILKHRGIEDEEAWAYLIGYLTDMFYDLYLGEAEETKGRLGSDLNAIWIHKKYNREYRIVSDNARLKDSNGDWIDCVIYAPLYENEYEMFAREKESFYNEFEKK